MVTRSFGMCYRHLFYLYVYPQMFRRSDSLDLIYRYCGSFCHWWYYLSIQCRHHHRSIFLYRISQHSNPLWRHHHWVLNFWICLLWNSRTTLSYITLLFWKNTTGCGRLQGCRTVCFTYLFYHNCADLSNYHQLRHVGGLSYCYGLPRLLHYFYCFFW